ncbi:DUF1307 domain-containing protein [Anaerorhabdus furcosa]|uniref:Uncharacterized lipoprotein YehR, DUF1307 family n=1 Tax=Anaerorhabdus furcosa TaxID=118967 RepID=A0A1T4QBL8_9FIRM|nr:DUF1307 domain-containing protein [Anaerorhabdus furcosa]SKA01119.1 Uncharacterized lipoprotein YehR, DUF1307 family [Anaerorhabdus furcosa]
MKKIGFCILIVMLLTGCANAPKEVGKTMTCKQDGEVVNIIVIFTTNKDDEIISSSVNTTIKLNTPEDAIVLQASLLQQKLDFEGIEGIKFDYDIKDNQATIIGEYDITKISADVLPRIGFTDDLKTNGKFKTDKFSELYEEVGVACIVE